MATQALNFLSRLGEPDMEREIVAALEFAIGYTDKMPETGLPGVHPTRLRAFMRRWCDQHGVRFDIRKPAPTGAARSETRPAAAPPPRKRETDFINLGRQLAIKLGIPLGEAMSRVARSNPQVYEMHIEQSQKLAALRHEHRLLTSQNEGVKRRLNNH